MPGYWTGGGRRKGVREPDPGSRVELREPGAPMPREKPKWDKPRGESTDAEHWDGPTRTSDEGQ